jgi:DNA-binding transcriptional MerR regulator
MLTINEISQEIHIPESTLRYWRDKYADFLPSAGSGRKKRYSPAAIPVFKTIAELSAENKTAADITERLSLEYTRVIEIANKNSGNANAMELYGTRRTLQKISDTLDAFLRQQAETEQLKAEITSLSKRLDELEQKKTPWYKRKAKK